MRGLTDRERELILSPLTTAHDYSEYHAMAQERGWRRGAATPWREGFELIPFQPGPVGLRALRLDSLARKLGKQTGVECERLDAAVQKLAGRA